MKKKRKYILDFSINKFRILRVTLFFCCICFFYSFSSENQLKHRINLNLENVMINDVFKKITEQTKLKFFFNNDEINVKKRVNVDMTDASIEQVLSEIFKGYEVKYEVNSEFVVIHSITEIKALPQKEREISGTVKDLDGLPLPGVTVVIKGTTSGTATDENGFYRVKVPESGEQVLIFSFVGMNPKEVKLGSSNQINMVLEDEVSEIAEVVVTGMAQVDKRIFTGATDRLAADEIMLVGVPEISRALEGRSAGVSVQNVSGTFGAAPKIRVRGATSIYGNSRPLWVVDGVIMEDVTEVNVDDLASGDVETLIGSAVAGLNSDDIESFQILKDGSATSIYGARAMAGVIVITTKKGRAGVNRLSYTGEFTMRLKPRYGDFNIMNSQEQMGIYKEMAQKGWLNYSDMLRASSSGVYGKMYKLMNTYDPETGQFMMLNTEESKRKYLKEAEMRNTDWFDILFRHTIMHSHSLGFTSGTDRSSSYASMSVMLDPGWAIQSSVQRYTANLNHSYKVFPNLSLNIIANASYRHQKAPGTQKQEIDAVNGDVKRSFDINPYSYSLNTSRALDPDIFYKRTYADFNIIHELSNNYIELNVVDLKFQGETKWRIIPSLEVAALGALKYQTTTNEHFVKDESNQAMAYRAMDDANVIDNNPFLYNNPDNPYDLAISILPSGGIYRKHDYKMLGYDFRSVFTWNKVFNDIHITNFFGGMEINAMDRKKTTFNGWGLQYSLGETPFYVYEFFKQGVEMNSLYYSIDNTKSRNAAFFGTGTYSYRGKYTLNGTIRYEGSNKLGMSRSARWLPTWNISGAWNVHEENFFPYLGRVLTHATLKASYSLTADRGPSSATNSQVVIVSSTPHRPTASTKEVGLSISGLENSELTYEKKHEFNLGVSLGFLNDRINLDADWYKRNNFDLIDSIYSTGVGGKTSKYANVASMKSYGFEFSLNSLNVSVSDFTWSTDIIFSYAKNEITKLTDQSTIMRFITGSGYAKKGYPVRSLFSIQFVGLSDRGHPILIDENGEPSSKRINFQSTSIDYLKYEGPTDPIYTGSFGNTFKYRKLQLNVFMTYSFGNKIRLDPVFSHSYTDLTATPREFKNRWTLPGDEKITNIPAIVSNRETKKNTDLKYAYSAYNYSTERIADGGFIRLKEISLAYDFSKSLLETLKISSLSLKLQATNLCLVYADKKLNGQDPEFFKSGGVASPMPKQLSLSVRLGF